MKIRARGHVRLGLQKDCNANSATNPDPAAMVSVATPGRQMYVAGIFGNAETALAAVATLAAFAAMGKDGCGGCHNTFRRKE